MNNIANYLRIRYILTKHRTVLKKDEQNTFDFNKREIIEKKLVLYFKNLKGPKKNYLLPIDCNVCA